MGIAIGGVAAGASLINGLFSHPTASNVQMPAQYQYQNQGGADTNLFSGIQNLPGQNLGQWSTPLAQQTGNALYNNPYAGAYQQGAGQAAGMGQQAAVNAYGAGGALGAAGMGQLPYANAIEQTAFDPQQALYQRTLGQVTDQTRSGLEARGIDNTPYGASVEGNTMSNFNIDWQNQQLARQQQGISGAATALGAGGGAIQSGQGLQTGAGQNYLTASAYPYATFQGIGQGQLGALTGTQGVAGGAQSLAQQPLTDYQNYLSGATAQQGANQQGAQVALNQQQMQFQQQQFLNSQVGAGLYGLGNAYSKAGGPSGSSMFGNMMSGTPWG